jgi:uncharacterized protein
MTSVASDSPQLGPIQVQERIALLDVLRGFAILGILLVNHNLAAPEVQALFPSTVNHLGPAAINVLGLWKFWPLFALLFGVGLAIQIERAEARGQNLIPLYLRRLFFLAVFGFFLECFIDVPFLFFLAVAGVSALFVGFLLRRRRVFWLLFVAPFFLAVNLGTESWDLPLAPPDVSEAEVAARIEGFRAVLLEGEAHAASWNAEKLIERIGRNLRWYKRQLSGGILGTVVGKTDMVFFMLLGIFLWRTGVLRNAERNRRLFFKLFLATLLIGLPVSVYTAHTLHNSILTVFGLGSHPTQLQRTLFLPLMAVSSLGMSLAYMAAFSLLCGRKLWKYLEYAFAPVGRMALTNYALQDLLPALVFGEYTPGIHWTSFAVWPRIFLFLGLFILQVLFSRAWLRRFRFGPFEWLWRSLTYWNLQPMRVRTSSPTT